MYKSTEKLKRSSHHEMEFWLVVPLFQTVSQIELAILKFPYDSWGTPFQQLKQVVDEASPQLPAERFSPEFVDFISKW